MAGSLQNHTKNMYELEQISMDEKYMNLNQIHDMSR